jgi:hypothetical protein
MEFTTYVRKPFTVEAVQVTKENIAEIAEMIGTLHYEKNGSPYIQVNQQVISNLFRIQPGFWVTKMGSDDNIRCYSKRIFNNQFVRNTIDIKPWLAYFGINNTPIDSPPGATAEDNATEDINVPLFTNDEIDETEIADAQ